MKIRNKKRKQIYSFNLKYDVDQKYLDAGLNLAILNVNRAAVKLVYRNGAEKTDDVS